MKEQPATSLSIAEFLRLTRISERKLLLLLGRGELPITVGPLNELRIDIAELSPEQLAVHPTASQYELNIEHSVLTEERIATHVLALFDGMVEEAMELALDWFAPERPPRDEK